MYFTQRFRDYLDSEQCGLNRGLKIINYCNGILRVCVCVYVCLDICEHSLALEHSKDLLFGASVHFTFFDFLKREEKLKKEVNYRV